MNGEDKTEKKNILRRLYDWTISWAEKPQATVALGALSFSESSFFPIPPDVLLIPLALAKPKKWYYYAFICTIFSVLGAVLAYIIGYFAWDTLSDIFYKYVVGFTPENFAIVENMYKENALLAVFSAAFTPIPFKIFTITAGICKVSLLDLIIASLLGRGGRFFLVSLIIRLVGEKAKGFIEKYFNILSFAFLALLILGFLIVKYIV